MEPGDNVQGAVKLDGDAEEALFDFSVMLLDDLGSGEIRPMEHYQERFPGYEREVAEEYSAICHVSPTELQSSLDLMDPEPRYLGDLRIGNYMVERELGRGGQATVYSARDMRMDRSVALKVLSSTFGRVPSERMERFRREAAAVANIDHPCICDVFEADFDSEPPYIAMRLVRGDSIRQHIQRAMLITIGELDAERDPNLPCFPRDEEELFTILRVFERLARALHAAHEDKVIHRDIKPANLILDESGTPMILDFGLARIGGEDSSTLTVTGEVFGTPAYMPPELLRGLVLEPGPSLDVYALAITLYECLTLKRPFDAGTPEAVYKQILEDDAPSVREFHPDLPREVAVVIATALEKDLKRRYATALDFAEELRRICEHEPIVAIPAGAGLRLKRWLQRHPALGTSIAGSILILMAGLTISLLLLDQVAKERDKKEQLLELWQAAYFRESATMKQRSDPVHALLLATEAYRRDPLEINHREIRQAMDLVHEVARVRIPFQNFRDGPGFISGSAKHPSMPWFVYCDRFDNLWFHDYTHGRSKQILKGHISEDAELAVQQEMAKSSAPSLRVAYDSEGVNLFLTRGHGEVIEVRSPDAEEVRCELAVEGELILLLGQSADRALTVSLDEERRMVCDLQLWDAETGTLIAGLQPDDALLRWAQLSPDGTHVAVGLLSTVGEPARVEVWDMEAGRRVVELPSHSEDSVYPLQGKWSPTGDRLFTCARNYASNDNGTPLWRASLWSLPEGTMVAELEHEDPCEDGVFSADGATLATACSESGVVWVWDGRTGAAMHALEGHDQRTIVSVSFSDEHPHLLASTSYDQTTRIWDVRSGEVVKIFRGMRTRPKDSGGGWVGELYMSLTEKGVLHTWSAGPQVWPKELSVAGGEVEEAWYAEGGEALVLRGDAGALEVRSWETGESLATHEWSAPDPEVLLVDDARGVVIARTSGDTRAVEWNWRTDVERRVSGAGSRIVEVTPYAEGDARHLLLCDSAEVEAWNLDLDEKLFVIRPSKEETRRVVMESCEAKGFVATGAADGYLRIWSATTGALLHELGPFTPHNGDAQISDILFAPDGESVYAASRDARIREWRIDTGELLVERSTHTTASLALVGEEHLLANAAYRGMLLLFERSGAMGGAIQISLGAQPGASVTVSRDGRHILYADTKSSVQLLEVAWLKPVTGDKERARVGSFSIDPHSDEQLDFFEAAVFSPDDQHVLAVGDGKAWIWPRDILSVAEQMSPVGIDFFGGLPSPNLQEEPVK